MLSLTFLLSVLCFVIVIPIPLGNNYGLSMSTYLPTHLGNREKQGYHWEERMKLPNGQAMAQIREIDKNDNDHDDSGTDMNVDKNDDLLIDQLNDLKMALWAQNGNDQLNMYISDLPILDEYQFVKKPRSSIRRSLLSYATNIDDNENELTPILTNDQSKIALPIIDSSNDELYETIEGSKKIPKYILIPTAQDIITIPNNMIEEDLVPVDEDALNDLELRNRIAILADALNDRAIRGM